MSEDFGLVETDEVDSPGDEWEEIDVSDTEADRIARERDREFADFRERIKDTEQFKVEEGVFDEATYAAIYRLVQDGVVEAFGGPISTGKEANVYTALGGERARRILDREGDVEIAIKVYRIRAASFKDMREYLVGDPRFAELSDKKDVVLAWTRKEQANLERARDAGVRVPTALDSERNVLAMEFIGSDGERAKRLTEVHIENPETAYEVLREYIRRLYDAGLVHGDLSPFNVLFHAGQLVVIDVGQAVTIHHPESRSFLERDCDNVANFFAKQGVDTDGEQLLSWVLANADPDK